MKKLLILALMSLLLVFCVSGCETQGRPNDEDGWTPFLSVTDGTKTENLW